MSVGGSVHHAFVASKPWQQQRSFNSSGGGGKTAASRMCFQQAVMVELWAGCLCVGAAVSETTIHVNRMTLTKMS